MASSGAEEEVVAHTLPALTCEDGDEDDAYIFMRPSSGNIRLPERSPSADDNEEADEDLYVDMLVTTPKEGEVEEESEMMEDAIERIRQASLEWQQVAKSSSHYLQKGKRQQGLTGLGRIKHVVEFDKLPFQALCVLAQDGGIPFHMNEGEQLRFRLKNMWLEMGCETTTSAPDSLESSCTDMHHRDRSTTSCDTNKRHTLLGRAKRAVSMLDVTAALTEKLPDKPVARLTDDVTEAPAPVTQLKSTSRWRRLSGLSRGNSVDE